MKFVCLSYRDEKTWNSMPESQREAMIEECLTYDEVLQSGGHWTGSGEALQSVRAARTLRRKGGKTTVTDGPYAETKEQLGGFGVLEARDMKHAVELMSKHPGVRYGTFEIRPIDTKMFEHCNQGTGAPDAQPKGKKFICLKYGDEKNWHAMSPSEQEAMIEDCSAYGDMLRQYGAGVGGDALQAAASAKSLQVRGGKVLMTDGPYAETKEQLGGYATFRFSDMEQAVEAWSNHPCLLNGDFLEIRPADEEFAARVEARLEQVQLK